MNCGGKPGQCPVKEITEPTTRLALIAALLPGPARDALRRGPFDQPAPGFST